MRTNWTSRFRQGRNIAVENSLRLNIKNETTSIQNPQFFSLGSQGTPNYVANNGLFFPLLDLINSGVVDADFGFLNNTYLIFDGANVGAYSTTFIPLGTKLEEVPALVGTITAPNGESTPIFYIEYPINIKLASFFIPVITIPTRLRFTQNPTPPLLPYFQTQNVPPQGVNSYDPNNPFVFVGTQTDTPISQTQNSGVDNSYGILCIDVFSQDTQQVLQPINYQYKDVNGNDFSFGADPIVNPYQPQVGTIRCVDIEKMQLNVETTLSYQVLPQKSALVTINYVKFSIWDYYEFDRIFAQQIRDNYMLQKKLLDRGRISLLNIE